MRKFIIGLVTFFSTILPVMAEGLDTQIDKYIAPASDAVSNFIFYPLSIAGVEVPIVILWLFLGSVVFTFYFDFIAIWGFKHAIDVIFGFFEKRKTEEEKQKEKEEGGEVSSFQALATALSGTVGMGNIAGVAIAVSLGGPGATFWMGLGAIFGMAAKFVECALGVKYRQVNEDGSVSGGPMYYISEGLKRKNLEWLGKPLAAFFALMCIGGTLGGGNMIQINQATEQFINITGGESSFLYGNAWMFGLFIAIVIALIIIGGIKSIANVTSKLVPFMCGLYLVAAIIVILFNITNVPAAIVSIIKQAFAPEAIHGGIIGTMIIGLRRSVQSNEAGVGSAPIAYAAVKTKEPVSQGFVSLLEPFIDTIILCSTTALVIVTTGVHEQFKGDTSVGVEMTSRAFETVIPFFPVVLGVAIILFALSTLISWSYYGQKGWTYLVGEGKKRIWAYQLFFCSFIVIGSAMRVESVVKFTDAMNYAMALPNVLAMLILMPELKRDVLEYCKTYGVKAFTFKELFVSEKEEVPEV